MVLNVAKHDNSLVVYLRGELDHHSAAQVRKELDALLEDESITELVLDLGGLEFMDSSGIGVLLGRYKKLSARGGQLKVMNICRQVQKVFEISGLFKLLG